MLLSSKGSYCCPHLTVQVVPEWTMSQFILRCANPLIVERNTLLLYKLMPLCSLACVVKKILEVPNVHLQGFQQPYPQPSQPWGPQPTGGPPAFPEASQQLPFSAAPYGSVPPVVHLIHNCGQGDVKIILYHVMF